MPKTCCVLNGSLDDLEPVNLAQCYEDAKTGKWEDDKFLHHRVRTSLLLHTYLTRKQSQVGLCRYRVIHYQGTQLDSLSGTCHCRVVSKCNKYDTAVWRGVFSLWAKQKPS